MLRLILCGLFIGCSLRPLTAEVSVVDAQKLLEDKGKELQDQDLELVGAANELTTLDLSNRGRITEIGG